MDLKTHSGDAYDLVKRVLMEILAPLEEWRVVPMFTGQVCAEDLQRFQDLLQVEVLPGQPWAPRMDRENWMSVGDWQGHALFDPTTGVWLRLPDRRNPEEPEKRIFGDELVRLVQGRPDTLTLVFDQGYSRQLDDDARRDAIEFKLGKVCVNGVYGIAYNAQASFLILSSNRDLIAQARQRLEESGIPPRRIAGPLPG